MNQGCLYIGDHLTDEMASKLTVKEGAVVQVTGHSNGVFDSVTNFLEFNLGSVEGQARLLDWLRQNEAPTRIICELHAFEVVADDTEDTRSATDYLTAQLVGVTRLLEASLSLNPNLVWDFLQPYHADVWSRACEAYFRVLIEGLRVAAPGAHFNFVTAEQVAAS